MRLGTRIGLAMAGLVGATALTSAVANVNSASSRLNAEIRRSIDAVATPVSGSIVEAKSTCGIAGLTGRRGDDTDDKGPVRRTPRELIVQCLDTAGSIMATSPSKGLPVDDATRELAKSGGVRRENSVTVDDERLLLAALPVKGFGVVQVARSVAERDRVLASLVRRNLLIAIIASTLAALVGALLASRISRPLRRLTQATESIGASGDLSGVALVETRRRDEIGQLSGSFVSMVSTLRDSKEAQARLVQDAGHELRTPLTSLRMNVALLGRETLSEGKRAEIRADIEAELRELTLVTNELVQLAGDSGRSETPREVNLGALVESSAQRWSRRSGRIVSAHIDATASGISVLIAEVAAQRIVDNLLSNAIKFSSPPEPIDIAANERNGSLVLTVTDHGPGISVADQAHIFDRFYRADSARSVTGSGLGLSIIKDLVENARGTVVVRSPVADGIGTRFVVSFPVTSADHNSR
jgi:two-component system, OmpR family, sensor histidine kinase MprB